MAFEKTRKQGFNPANITVNRGNAKAQFGQQVFADRMALIDTQQNFIDKKLDDYIGEQKLEGTKVAESTEMVMEERVFTNEDGSERTYSIPVSYNRPEELIKTKWAANTYDEQIEKSYTDAVITSANEIILAEKSLQKTRSNYQLSVAESTALFSNNVQEGLDALKATVPQRYQQYVDTQLNTMVAAANTEIGNDQYGKLKTFNKALGKERRDEYDVTFNATLFNGNAEAKLQILEDQYKHQSNSALAGDEKAVVWMEETYPAHKEMIELSGTVAPFFDVNFDNQASIVETIYNLNSLELFINNDEDAGFLLTSDDKTPVKLNAESIKALGYDVSNMKNKKKIQAVLSRYKELLKERLTERTSQDGTLDHNRRTNRMRLGQVAFQSPALKKDYAIQLGTAGSKLNKNNIAEFVAYKSKINESRNLNAFVTEFDAFTMMNPEHNVIRDEYYSYVAAKYKNLPEMYGKSIKDNLSSFIANIKDGSIVDNRQAIEEFYNSPAFRIARGVQMNNKEGKAMFISMLENVPNITDKEIKLAKRMMSTMSSSIDGNGASNHLIKILQKEAEMATYTEAEFKRRLGFDNPAAIETKIDEQVLDLLSSKFFTSDIKISQRYSQAIKQRVYEELMLSVEADQEDAIGGLINSTVMEVANRLEKNGRYGESTFTSGKGITDDGNENNEGPIAYGEWSLNRYFIVDVPDNGGFTKTETGEYSDKHIEFLMKKQRIEEAGGRVNRTKSWMNVNNKVIAMVNDPKAKVENKQFDFSVKLELGKNYFLEPVNPNMVDSDKVVYQAVFYGKPGGKAIYMKDENGNPITFTRSAIEKDSANNNSPEVKVEELKIEQGLVSQAKEAILKDFFPLTMALSKKKKQDEIKAYRDMLKRQQSFMKNNILKNSKVSK